MQDPVLKSNPVRAVQKRRRNKKNKAKQNCETLFFVKQESRKIIFSKTKRTLCKTDMMYSIFWVLCCTIIFVCSANQVSVHRSPEVFAEVPLSVIVIMNVDLLIVI
jgi:hypothetical protein